MGLTVRTATLKPILALGHYAVLLAVAGALAVFAAWLIALDHDHGLALAISPVVLPFTTGAVFQHLRIRRSGNDDNGAYLHHPAECPAGIDAEGIPDPIPLE
jgi:hypothetical protein